MSKIEQLIVQLCPDGVTFKELWDVTLWDKRFNNVENWKQPKVLSFTHILSSELKRLDTKSGDIKLLATGKFDGYTTNEIAGSYINDGEVITIPSGGSANIKYYKGKFVDSGNILGSSLDESILNLKFCYYFLLTKNDLIENYFRGSGVKHPSMSEILSIQIPIPPLPIQQEIVNILDKFTQLEAELEAELEARKKQYEYHRNELLNFEGKKVEWKMLGQVAKILRGTAITQKETTSGEIPVVANSPNPVYFHNESNRIGETVVIARSGAYAGLVSYWNEPFFLTDAFSIHPSNNFFKTKFVFYVLKNEQEKIHQMKKGSGVPHVRANDFETYSIPIPPMEEQERIVGILDKFDALVNDISVGLPAEIAARRKQYEYYRGKLLDFKNVING